MFVFVDTEILEGKRPRRLSSEDLKAEMAERERRKKQMIILDDDSFRLRNLEEVRQLVKKVTGLQIGWNFIREVNQKEKLVEVEIFDDKVDLIRRRHKFRMYKLYFKDHRTARELEISKWMKEMVIRERKQGRRASAGYQKINVNGVWKEWNEKRGCLELQTSRNAKRA